MRAAPSAVPPARAAAALLLLALALGAAAVPARGDDGGIIVGRVFDRRTGGGLPFAAVLVQAVPATRGTSADEDGRFRITGVPGGSWSLEVSARPYDPVTGAVPVAVGETTEVSVSLGPPGDTLVPPPGRAGPRAPFLVSFPRQHELRGEGLISYRYSAELPRAVGFTADGSRVALETGSGLTLYRSRDGLLLPEHELRYAAGGPHDAVGLGPHGVFRLRENGDALMTTEADAVVREQPVRLVGLAQTGPFDCAFSARRGRLAAWDDTDSAVAIWQLDEGRRLVDLRPGVLPGAAAFLPDPVYVAVAGRGQAGTVELWSVTPLRRVARRDGAASPAGVRSLAVDPLGRYLFVGGADSGLTCLRLPDLMPRWQLAPGGCCPGEFLEPSPDGKLLVTGSGSGLLFVDVESGRPVRKLTTNHGRGIRAAAFRPDGRVLATIGYDAALALWDVHRIVPEGSER